VLGLAGAHLTFDRVLPGKEGEHRAGAAGLVAVIEVIGPGVVEVDRALDQPQAQRACIEIQVSQRVAGNGRDVVQAGHGASPWRVTARSKKLPCKLVRKAIKTIVPERE
jgi:hypothetical protein